MARRKAYTKVQKENQIRTNHVKGMGDKLLKGFQCLNAACREFLFILNEELSEDFEIVCPVCQFNLKSGEETAFYDYQLENTQLNQVIETGTFSILHDDYIAEAQFYKYCIICNTIKPVYLFDVHNSRKSGRQGECRLCKSVYNSIKNQTRITDQHREAAQKRRMYLDLAGGQKIESKEIHERFKYKCFKCDKELKNLPPIERPLDHTLPVYYLWPLTTENATLLCRAHNSEKSGKWPSDYYNIQELRKLSLITGFKYEHLTGTAFYNPEAIEKLKNPIFVDAMLTKFSAYLEEIIKLRNRLKFDTGLDFFEFSTIISQSHIQRADKIFASIYGK